MALAAAHGDSVAVEPARRRCPVCGIQTGPDGCRQCDTVARRRASAAAGAEDGDRSATTGGQRDLLHLVGYLIAAAGFVVTLFPGWWMTVGFVCVWVGYALGARGVSFQRWRDGLVVGIALTLLGVTLGDTVLARRQTVAAPGGPQPFLEVTIQTSRHRSDELFIRGTISNVGDEVALSPSVELMVRDVATGSLVAADTAYADRTPEAELAPGGEAPFVFTAFVPHDPRAVEWEIVVEDYPGRVTGKRVGRQ